MSLTVQQRYCARTVILAHPCLNLSYVRDLVPRSKDGVGLDKGWLLLEQISILICEWAHEARAQVGVSVNWGWCQFWVAAVFGREEWTWKVLWSRLQIPTFGLWDGPQSSSSLYIGLGPSFPIWLVGCHYDVKLVSLWDFEVTLLVGNHSSFPVTDQVSCCRYWVLLIARWGIQRRTGQHLNNRSILNHVITWNHCFYLWILWRLWAAFLLRKLKQPVYKE